MSETKNRCTYTADGGFVCTNISNIEHSDCSYRVDPVGEISSLCPQYKICEHMSGIECTCIQACRDAAHTFAKQAMERSVQAHKECMDAANVIMHLKLEEEE